MRIEIPGPAGLRLLAVLRDGRLVATFPSAGAVYEAPASAASLDALLGVGLEVSELMDFLVGVPSVRLSDFRVRWGSEAPTEVSALLSDGTRLKARVDSVTLAQTLPPGGLRGSRHLRVFEWWTPKRLAGSWWADDRCSSIGTEDTLGCAPTTLPSFAKINLGLEVLGIREDGYHELRTVFQSVALFDEITLAPGRPGVALRCAHPLVPKDERNLAVRAALELLPVGGHRARFPHRHREADSRGWGPGWW